MDSQLDSSPGHSSNRGRPLDDIKDNLQEADRREDAEQDTFFQVYDAGRMNAEEWLILAQPRFICAYLGTPCVHPSR